MRTLTSTEASERTGGATLPGSVVVELSPTEQVLHDTFDGLLDQGYDQATALGKIRAAITPDLDAEVDPAFWAWLAS